MSAHLLIIEGPEPGLTVPLNEGIQFIGRDTSTDICIPHPSISKIHASIDLRGGELTLSDCDSTNGIKVHGEKHKQIKIEDQDTFLIGDILIRFISGSDIKNTLLRSSFKSKTFKILFAGNLGAAQNLEIVIKIAKIIKKNKDNIKINLVGNGNQFSLIKDLINKNKLDDIIKLHGYISVSKVKKYYQKADALLLTLHDGKALNKTIPAKFQTYLAYAKPILISANGEINNLVKQKKLGLSSRAGYYNNLYINILRLKNMTKKEIDNISLNCTKFYKSDFMLAKNVSYLQKILNKLT